MSIQILHYEFLGPIKLDEWGGIPIDNPATCESFLQTHLIKPLQIHDSRYIGFDSNPQDPDAECKKVKDRLEQEGPIDLCILGIGMNGHLALNEPADFLSPHCHVTKLSDTSLEHPMVLKMRDIPTFGLTLGMADILKSKLILMLIHGPHKRNIAKQFLSQEITNLVPASFLWLHPNAVCLIEKKLLKNETK